MQVKSQVQLRRTLSSTLSGEKKKKITHNPLLLSWGIFLNDSGTHSAE